MGSLVPGWDADLGVPRDLVPDNGLIDIDKEPQPIGYFEKLRSHRHGADVSGDQAGPPASPSRGLARVSAPQYLARSASKQAPVPRANTLSHGVSGSGPQKYQLTDWSSELTTLRSSGLARSSLGSSHEGSREHVQEGGPWWRSLEVGHLNEHPDAASNFVHDTQRSTFVPQFTTQSSKLDFGDEGDKDKQQQ
ncbi:hypothetical protein PLESTB_000474700 [Pleodorina starrii]|uniref:Uncharacterized protein n=1 Tax=Pleodorina starrii TaxID=330485 RepID=A0A9W6F0J6_9CHLO|nr:hypothetical protein PLESTM_001592000 [Pleodorina starrii]GLC51181.1 hypothetical protein PLESTB_000474700 [Pleodorina starrii]GLC63539.1 hypothetical protein PLESTF_000047200 [Pleodorina starrii]